MIGVITSDFNQSLVEGIENYDEKGSVVLFSNNPAPHTFPKTISSLQTSRIYNFKGTAIAENLESAEVLCSLVCPSRKIFYVRSLEWMNIAELHYNALQRVYNNDSIELLAANDKIYNILESLFKKPIGVVEDWDFNKLKDVL